MTLKSPRLRNRIERLWRSDLPRSQWPLWAALTPLSAVYRIGVAMRSEWWQRMAETAQVPTISVGNLTVGGNAKTPFALFLASRLASQGLRVGIASRGYGRDMRRRAGLVSDDIRILMNVHESGDEPAMMARSFAGPIAVARRRIDAIDLMMARTPVDLVILDDGFQHQRLRHDLDLVLINEAQGFRNGWVLPAGPMREPAVSLRRADAVVLISAPGAEAPATISDRITAVCDLPMIRARLKPRALVSVEQGAWRESAPEIAGRRVLAVSGLADASGFHAMIRELGAEIADIREYPDHYDYGPADWENILVATRGCDLVLTTEKDLVKLERFALAGVAMAALRIEVTMPDEEERRLLDMIMRSMRVPVTACAAPQL